MKLFGKALLVLGLMVGAVSVSASEMGSVNKGKYYFQKQIKDACGKRGDVVAKMHTQDEWQEIRNKGMIGNEIAKICPKVDPGFLIAMYTKHYAAFLYEFASDSGNEVGRNFDDCAF